MSVTRRTCGATLLILGLVAGTATAQTKTGTTIGQFLGIEPSARHAAMGNAGTALTEDIESVYFNPGVIGGLDRPGIEFTHNNWFADIGYDYAAVAVPVSGFGTLFGSVTALNSGEIDVRTVDQPLGTGERYTVSNVALGLGYGRQITSRFAVGLQFNYVHERIWHSEQNTWTASFGTTYRLTGSGVQLGFSLLNLGTDSRYSGRDLAIQYDNIPDEFGDNSALPGEQLTGEFPVPIQFRIGLSFPFQLSKRSRLLLLADALHPNDNTESLNVGAEWTLLEVLALRAGYQTLFQEDTELGLTLGFGIKIAGGRFRVGYAWAEHDHLDATHRFTLVLGF